MGAWQSTAVVSGSGSAGHHVHREGRDHRLKRVSSNEVRAPCMLCSKPVEFGTIAYRCGAPGCGIVLHDGCKHLPRKIKHFAHSGSGHQLTLSDTHQMPAGAAGRRRSCNICAGGIDDVNFVYACSRCHGFYAHPNCCRLPQTVHNSALHKHALTLLPPPSQQQPRGNGHGHRHGRGGGGRICHNTVGNCRNAANRFDGDAWSYQCNLCRVEVCLACQLPDGGDGPPVEPAKNGCGGNVVGNLEVVGQQLATATGTVLRALCCAWLGAPMPPPAAPTPASNPK